MVTGEHSFSTTEHQFLTNSYTSDSGFNMDYLIKNYNYNFIDDMLGNKAIDAVMFILGYAGKYITERILYIPFNLG